MEPILLEIIGSANGRFNLSSILDQLDKLRRTKRIDMDLYDKIYKRIISESRNFGDKWYQRYASTTKEIKEATSLNFSFDFKYDENNPNSSNRLNQSNIKNSEKQTFSSPTTFASPPTYETRASRLTEFQSDYQKEYLISQTRLTNQILKQISEGKKRSVQSEHLRSDKIPSKPLQPLQRSSSLINLNGISQLITLLQRKVMQLYRLSLNKIIYVCNEPIKLQDVEKQSEPLQLVQCSIKKQFQIEQNIKKFEEGKELQILFKYFDNMKQYWLRKRNLKRSGNSVLAMRKTNYIQKAFEKLRKYAKIHKHKRLNRLQAEYFFKLKIQKRYFNFFLEFLNKQIKKKYKKKICIGFLQLSSNQLLNQCFEKLKIYYRKRKEKYRNNLLANGMYQQNIEKLYFGLWHNIVANLQKRETSQFIIKKCLRKWKQYLKLKEFNKIQKQKSFEKYRKICKVRILKVFSYFLANLRMKKQMNLQLLKKYLDNLLQRGFDGFRQFVQIKKLKKQKYQLVGRFLQEIYVSKPFKILESYKRERHIKKELDGKAKLIYRMNKQRKLMNFWSRWAKQKSYHKNQDLQNIPQLKQLIIFLCFKRMKIAFQQSLWLKNLVRIMKSKYNKEFIKELKLNNIHFKQQNKYPLKLKSKVFRAFRKNVISHLKKQQFHDQLLSLHQQNLIKHIFKCMKIRAENYRQKKMQFFRPIPRNKRAINRQVFGKYIAGPFYSWLNFSQQHSYKKNVKDNFDKLMIIKQYQKVFNVLNEYRWKKKMQKHKDNKFIPVIIKNLKVKHIRFWNAKMQSQMKIDNFCNNFTKLQMKKFFKHMHLIRVRDYQKKKYMAQGRIFYMLKFAFNQLNKYKTYFINQFSKKIKQRTNFSLIKKRQTYHIKKSCFKHIQTLFTFEQNIAYLTAVTILQIKRNLQQKYFKGFKDLIQQKKRPRDQIMKLNKLRKCFAGWKIFTHKQQGVKLLIQSIIDIQKDQKAKLYSKLRENNQIHEARIYFKTSLAQRVVQFWQGVTQSSQKITYLLKLLNQLKLKQLKKQFSTLSENFKLSQLIGQGDTKIKQKTLSVWKTKYKNRELLQKFSNLLEFKQIENITYGLKALQESNMQFQIQELQRKSKLQKLFSKWKMNWHKSNFIQKFFNLVDKQIQNRQNQFLCKINKLAQFKRLNSIKSSKLKKSFLKQWSYQLKKTQAIKFLQQTYDSIIQKRFIRSAKSMFKINKQQIYHRFIQLQQKSQLFTKWNKLTKVKLRIDNFNEILTRIFENKTYYKHCRTLFFFSLQNQQIKQLKGEFAMKALDKLVHNRQAMIFGYLQQDQQYLSFLEVKNRRTQIFCLTLWAKITNESIAYKFICRSLLEIYKRNMISNMKVFKSYVDKACILYQQLGDSKRKQILNIWFHQTQKRIAIKSIFSCVAESYDSKNNKKYHAQQFFDLLKLASTKYQNVSKLFETINIKINFDVGKAFQKIKLISKGQLIRNNIIRKVKQQYLAKWRKSKSILTLSSIIQGAYERTLHYNFNKLKCKQKNQRANQLIAYKLQNRLFQFFKAAIQKTQKKQQQLENNLNHQLLNIHFQVWFVECLKRNNQRKCLQRICRGFFLHHYRVQGIDFIKQLKLEKKLQLKAESESHYSQIYSVFKAWRMVVDERKMYKKYLQECTVEEKRGKSLPKNLPY